MTSSITFDEAFDPPVRTRVGSEEVRGGRYLLSPRLVATAVAVAFLSLFMTSVQAEQPVTTVAYTVGQGDTLWSIAESITAEGEDVREVLVVVRDLNDMDGSTIHPGQVLRLPTG